MIDTEKIIDELGLATIVRTIPYSIEDLAEHYEKDDTLNNIPLCIWNGIAGYHENPETGHATKIYSTFRILMYERNLDYTLDEGVAILKNAARQASRMYLARKPVTLKTIARKFKNITLELEEEDTILHIPNGSRIRIAHKTDTTKPYYTLQYADPDGNLGETCVTFSDTDDELNRAVYQLLENYYAEMPVFYFTFGSDELFPYQYGYLTVSAPDMSTACRIFDEVHPPRNNDGASNYAFVYTKKAFMESRNDGKHHEHIQVKNRTCEYTIRRFD